MKMRLVQPNEASTYQYAVDDHCLVVSSGDKEDAPKVWLSAAMLDWIADNGRYKLAEHYAKPVEISDNEDCGPDGDAL